jgi:glycosyltransferase involved in cell wall biosynthesis
MLAYNHQAYIQQAIDGVLMQQTNFDLELIISNDHSSDHTNEVICRYIKSHPKPETIKYFSQEKNLGMQSNFIFALKECKGKYIALCEGDDYWTDPLKLQKQVDYISSHADCNLVFTGVQLLEDATNRLKENWATITRDTYRFKDLIERNVFTTCTVLFRNPNDNKGIDNWLKNFKIGDYPLYLFLLRSGYAYYLKDITAVYRQHSGGTFSLKGLQNLLNTHIEVLETVSKRNLTKKELLYVKKSLVQWHYATLVRLSSKSHSKEVRTYVKKHFKLSDITYNPRYFMKVAFLFLFPKFKAGVFENSEITIAN